MNRPCITHGGGVPEGEVGRVHGWRQAHGGRRRRRARARRALLLAAATRSAGDLVGAFAGVAPGPPSKVLGPVLGPGDRRGRCAARLAVAVRARVRVAVAVRARVRAGSGPGARPVDVWGIVRGLWGNEHDTRGMALPNKRAPSLTTQLATA